MRAFYYIFFICFAFLACGDKQRSNYEISNTKWLGNGPEEALSIEFDFINAKISYGATMPYNRAEKFDYSPKNYQGSIFLPKFAFDTAENLDVTWLFTISDDTQNMKLELFKKLDKQKFTVFLIRQ